MHKRILGFLLMLLTCLQVQLANGQNECYITKLAQDLLDPQTSQAFKDFIKTNGEGMMAYKKLSARSVIRKDIDVLKATSDLLSRHAGYLADNPMLFENIIDNLAKKNVRCKTCAGVNQEIPSLEVTISEIDWALTNFKNKDVGFTKLLTEMGASPNKAEGGAYMLSVIKSDAGQINDYVNSIKSFEFRYLENGNFEADLARLIENKTHLWEYKSWSKTSWEMFSINNKSINQLKGYLRSFKDGQKFKYVANVTKLSEVDNRLLFVKNQFLEAFKKDHTIFDANPSFFKGIEFGGKTIDINSYQELKEFCAKENFVNSSLFNFVEVK